MRQVDEPAHRFLAFYALEVDLLDWVGTRADGYRHNTVLDVRSKGCLDELEAAQAINARDRWRLARGHAVEECPQGGHRSS